MPTVTLATCCHGRAEHVKETLPKNLHDNQQDFVRFLLVNYNSDDDLDEWAREELSKYLASGRVMYVHEKTAERFLHSHARNVAVRCCQTDVFCNVDADNFTNSGFGRWLSKLYADHPGEAIFTGYGGERGAPCGDLFGRISFRLKHLCALGGYNEDLNSWGVEDYDVVKRAEQAGFMLKTYPERFDTKALKHSKNSRVAGTGFDSPLSAMQATERMQLGKFGMEQMPNAKGQWGRATVEINWTRTVEVPLSAGERLP
jgi:hypothetical protein